MTRDTKKESILAIIAGIFLLLVYSYQHSDASLSFRNVVLIISILFLPLLLLRVVYGFAFDETNLKSTILSKSEYKLTYYFDFFFWFFLLVADIAYLLFRLY